jgi:NAD(P)-dependent dehydrogenase (short-subunit alcohol dehydrogenase family)
MTLPPSPTPRAALVTGAAKRLGRAIALGLAQQGYDIALHYFSSTQEAEQTARDVEALGVRVVPLKADLSDSQAVSKLFAQASSALPHLNTLINSASRFEYDHPTRFDPAMLQAHWPTNVTAPSILSHALFTHVKSIDDTARGCIVNLIDQKLDNLNPDFYSYTLTKAALLCATHMMAMSFGPVLRVNAVSPGATLVSWKQSEQGFEQANRIALLDRSSRADDIVQAVLYLTQAQAVTGSNLVVDGGQHLMPLDRDVMFLTKTF